MTKNAPYFLRRYRQPCGNAGDFAVLPQPDLRNDNLREVLGDLLKGLVAHGAFRPASQHIADARGLKDFCFQRNKILREMIVFF